MKSQNLLIVILFFILPFATLAQEQAYSITVKKAFGGTYKFIQNNKKMKLKEVIPIMQSNPEAYAIILKAQKTKKWYWGVGFAGIGLMGLQQVVSGGEPVPYLGVAGVGLIIATFPLLIIHGKQAKRAAEVYNAGLSTSINLYKVNVGITPK